MITLKKYKSFLFHISFFFLSIFLLYLVFRKQDFREIRQQIQNVDYRWVVLIIVISLFTQVVRAYRWKMLINPLQKNISTATLFWTLMFGYFVNLAIPRLGEISRCLVLKKNKNIEFTAALGTVVTERVVDVLSLFLMFFLAFLLNFHLFLHFIKEYVFIPVIEKLWHYQMLFWIIPLIFIGLLGLIWFLWKTISQNTITQKIICFIQKLWRGIKTISQMPNKLLFILLSVLIWYLYFLGMYFWFFSLPATAHLGVKEGITLLAISSSARLVPTQGGGIGAYQLFITQGFLLFGIKEVYGSTLAIVIHSSQLLLTLIMGGFAMLILLSTKTSTNFKK